MGTYEYPKASAHRASLSEHLGVICPCFLAYQTANDIILLARWLACLGACERGKGVFHADTLPLRATVPVIVFGSCCAHFTDNGQAQFLTSRHRAWLWKC